MDKKHLKSVQYLKKHSTLNSSYSQSNNIIHKEPFENGLSKIFSSPPALSGYIGCIESLINELGLKNEQHLNFTISSLSKLVRNKNETKIIASYLYLMPDFIKLLRKQEIDKNEQDILKDLLNLAQSIAYEKCEKNTILMKFGDKGSTAYIILDGKVDVLIKSFKRMIITKNDYLYYLANLLKYSEYGLLNETINENFLTFPIDLYDSKNIKHLNFNKINDFPIKEENSKNKTENNPKDVPFNKKRNMMIFSSKTLNFTEERTVYSDDKLNSSFNSLFKLNEENEQIKEIKSVFTISTDKLLKMFNLKKLDRKNSKKLNNCSINEYINRIELVPEHYKLFINKNLIKNTQKELEKDNNKETINDEDIKNYSDSEDENSLYNLKIFSYIKVATLGKGTLFGELALKDANSLRTGTIISSSDCHFSVLSKRVYDNCLKKGAEKYLKETLSFFINLPIFNGLPESLFYHKYYNYLSKKVILRGNCIINQGEKPKNIILVKTGIYGLTTRISLFDLTKLIYHFINLNLKNKGNINSFFDEEANKYNRLLKKTKNMMNESKILMNDNIKFKKYYLSEIYIRVTDISCPDILGYKDYIGENGLYAFSIEAKSPENIIFTLDNKFYSDLLHRNYIVRNNQKDLLEKKIDAIIQRLLIIRNSLVNSFFDDKNEKEINTILIKELENINISKLKQKRFLKFKATEYKFDKKIQKGKKYENKNNKNKYKKIINISRNNKLNYNSYYYNSLNLGESIQNKSKKSISQSHKSNSIKKISNANNKIDKNIINLYKTSKNFYSKNINKKKLINLYSKEKSLSSSNTLIDYCSKYKSNQKNNTNNNNTELNNSKINCEQQTNDEKIILLNSPKFNFTINSPKDREIKWVNYNSLVWEEIKTKVSQKNSSNDFINNLSHTHRSKKNVNILEKSNSFKKINNEEMKTPFNSCRYSSKSMRFKNKEINFENQIFKKLSLLHRTQSELSLKNNNIRIKSNLLRQIKTPNYIRNGNNTIDNNIKYYSPQNEPVPKIKLKIKKLFSPEQIKLIREINKKRDGFNIIKYYENKLEKYKLDRNFYYNNNLKNRMKLFYSIEKK